MYWYGIVVIVLSLFSSILSSQGASIAQPEINGANTALMYLSRFGYIDPSATNPETGSLMAKEAVQRAIMEFQAFAGLNQTGIMDESTVEMMNTPRCGVVDKVGFGTNARRKKRYALQGSRWKVNDLTYKVTKYPRGKITKSDVDKDIRRAFQVWADVTELTFTPVKSGKVHIEIRFEKGEHGDGDPFDGVGGTLAHAYFPIYGGDAHFDDSEKWTVYSYRGTNLFQTAAHEFGHSLGLSHSDVQSALMAPFYRGYVEDFKLDEDDITAIQSLYGKRTTKAYNPPQRPTAPVGPTGNDGDPILCKDGSIDAIVTMTDENTYVFKGKYFWRLIDDGIAEGYPQKISRKFDGLPADLDAAFTWTNGKTYFFKGSFYWRSTGFTMDDGYPKSISKGFMGIPDHVDAAFVWSGNGKIYFMKGTDYYKFDPTQRPPVAAKYPKDISLWEGLPYYLDDAFQYSNGYTYFFKNGKYYRFNDRSFVVDKTDPPFPRRTGPWWFGCPEMGSSTVHNSSNTNSNTIPEDYYLDSEDVDSDDSFNTDDYLYPRIGDPSYDYIYSDSGASLPHGKSSSYFSWLIIPLLLRLICA